MTKICSKCKVEKPRTEFYPRNTKDGLRKDCKECVRHRAKTYRQNNAEMVAAKEKKYYQEHKEEIAEQGRRYRAEHKDAIREQQKKYREATKHKYKEYCEANKEVMSARHKRWLQNNKDRVSAWRQAYNAAHKDAQIAYARKWRAANPEQANAQSHRRRARKRNAEGHFTAEDILALFEKQNGCCVYCRNDISLKYHIDHILALALGGTNWPSNLQLLCPSCNTSKGKKTHEDFIAYRVLLGMYVPPEFLLI